MCLGCVTRPGDPPPDGHVHDPPPTADAGATEITEFAPPRCDAVAGLDDCVRGFGFARCPGGDPDAVQVGCAEDGECPWFWGCAPASHAAACQCAQAACAHFVSLYGREPWDERRAMHLEVSEGAVAVGPPSVVCDGCVGRGGADDWEGPLERVRVGDARRYGVELRGAASGPRLQIEVSGDRARACRVRLVDHVDFHCHYGEPICAASGRVTVSADGSRGQFEFTLDGDRYSGTF